MIYTFPGSPFLASFVAGDLDGDGDIDLLSSRLLAGTLDVFEHLDVADPLVPDSDADGLPDGDEVNVHGTDPPNPDADGDGDGLVEVTLGTDPLDPLDFPESVPAVGWRGQRRVHEARRVATVRSSRGKATGE